MKKFLSILLAAVLVCTLAACGGETPATSSADAPASDAPADESAAPADDAAASDMNMSAAFVTVQPLGDPTIDLCYAGFTKAVEEFGFEKTTVVEAKAGEYEENFRALCEEGYGLIIANMPELQEAVGRVAPDYPDTKFMIALGEAAGDNVISTWNIEQYGTYITGVYAGLMTKTNKVAFLGGVDNDQLGRVGGGFIDGVKASNPDCEVEVLFVGSFTDPTKGKEMASLLYNEGCDIIFQACAQSGLGVFEIAKELGEGHNIIGIDVDQNGDIPGQVIGSFVTPYDQWVYEAMKEYAEGKFEGRVIYRSVAEGTTLKMATDYIDVPQEVIDAVDEATQKVLNGEVEPSDTIKKA